ncbi:MAG: hypothetical protein K1W39_04915 [Lachnospiraceae bacterium]|mgnify:CR=1 FL=1|uniref:Uncharacterized protein n=1 Tax=Xylanibacter caecicola TaxID=2736294 RepID=A0ABX2B519_9BACT|nr:hypothetical protein [Xylanibacter caecicola]NPE26361.1 hypothetical protein [Xylanibacter caecicola]
MNDKESFLDSIKDFFESILDCCFPGGCCLLVVLLHAIPLLIACLVASWLCEINPETTYSWYHGIWHGIFFIPNFLKSIFTDALFKAELYSNAYNVFWWITVVSEVLGVLGFIGKSSD